MATDNLIGKTINGYEITGTIGHGGMAAVYKAHQISMDRTVAIKVLPRQYVDDDTYIQRFQREVKIVSQLEHRSIVPVYDYGEHDRQPFIVMRYMPSGSVDSLLINGPVPVPRILEILGQVAPALDYAHSKNVLHRDLKPSNVLLDDGDGAYLTDFGIARILGEAGANAITTQGVVGTPAYMSPEQAQGKPLDGRSDVYSLGVMLFEMATGRRPFESDTPYGVAVMQVMTPPPQPRSLNPQLSSAVNNVIYRAMDKRPAARYQSATELAAALEAAWHTPSAIQDTQPRPQPTPPTVQPIPTTPPPDQQGAAPYAAPQPTSAEQSAWMPPVAARPPRRQRRPNAFMSLFVGMSIGCVLLVGLMAGAAYLWGQEIGGFFATSTAAPTADTVTPGGINIIGTPATRTPAPVTEEQAATLRPTTTTAASPTPPATDPPPPSPTASGPTRTPTYAPIGVRPNDGASIATPGGEVIYFTEQNGNFDLFRLNVVDGRVRRLTYGTRADQFPAVSPDGRHVAFVAQQDATWDLHLYNLETTGVERLTTAGFDLYSPAWSPDGEWLVFAADPRADGNTDLFKVRRDGSALQPLLSNGQRNAAPRWHDDRIVFATGDRYDARTWEIALLDLATNAVTPLTDNEVKDWNPSWGPGGGVILYHTAGEGGSSITLIDLIGNRGIVPVYDGPGYEWGAAYNPAGTGIVFSSDVGGTDQLYLYDGDEARPLTENGGFPAAWLPS